MNNTFSELQGKANSTADHESVTSVSGSSLEFRIIKFCVYVLIFVFSVGGNTLVILSVAVYKRMKTVPNIFIANLAICDLITTLTSIPFDLAQDEVRYFPFGRVTCKILWPSATISTTSACFTLLAISLDRYFAIIHPLNFGYRLTRRRCLYTIGLIHLISTIAVLPYFISLNYDTRMRVCVEQWPKIIHRKLYTVFLFLIQYGVPLLIMSAVYLKLGAVLFKSNKEVSRLCQENSHSLQHNGLTGTIVKEQSKSNILNKNIDSLQRRKIQSKKTVKMFLLIVIIFLIFMQPHQLFWLWMDFGVPGNFNIDLVAFVCRAFTYTNSVLNAIIYGICNKAFRESFASILRCRCAARHERDLKRTIFSTQQPSLDSPRKTPNCKGAKSYDKLIQNSSNYKKNFEENITDFKDESNSDEKASLDKKVSFKNETDTVKIHNDILTINDDHKPKIEAKEAAVNCRLQLAEAELLLEKLLLEIKLEGIDDLHPEVNVKFHRFEDCFTSLDETTL